MSAKRTLSCEEVLKQLFAYVDQELDSERRAEIDHHMEQCRGCYSRAEFEKRLKERIMETGSSETPERVRRRVQLLIDKF
jgi:mycothiol system anti-sigma-R factor